MTAAADSADLAVLRSIALRLSQGRSARPPTHVLRSYNPERFRRLLVLAGPENAAELLARLAEDIRSARQTAERAAEVRDWPALRGASHVLISLTGAVGALSLQEMSEQLNAATEGEDAAVLPVVMPAFLAELDALLHIIAAMPPEQGTP